MPRRARLSRSDVAALAPHRVVAVSDLVAAGMSSSTIARRIRSGLWQGLLPGVVLLQSGPATRDQWVHAAVLYTRPEGVVSGVEAVRRHGMRRLPDTEEIFVLVGEDRRRAPCGPIAVERTARLPEAVTRDGIAVAPFDRALMDAARRTADLDAVRAMIAEAVQRRRTTIARLVHELEAGNQRGSGRPREVLVEAAEGMRSAAEGWAMAVHRRSGLPPILWNPRLYLPSGRYLATPDAFFDDVALAWEIDSREFHPDGDDATARRHADLVGAGVLAVHHRPRRLLAEPDRVAEELWSHYLLAATRPRPAVRAVPAFVTTSDAA